MVAPPLVTASGRVSLSCSTTASDSRAVRWASSRRWTSSFTWPSTWSK